MNLLMGGMETITAGGKIKTEIPAPQCCRREGSLGIEGLLNLETQILQSFWT
jgi:hypothetical protein